MSTVPNYQFTGVDLAIAQNADGIFDLVIENGLLKNEYGFNTALLMSVLCERRADPSEVPLPQYQRGWWGNALLNYPDNFEIGSKLWLLQQSRATQEALNRAIDYITQATNWLIDNNNVDNVIVGGQLNGDGTATISVNLVVASSIIVSQYFTLWNKSGFPSITTYFN